MSVLDVFVCLALTLSIKGTDAAVRETAFRLWPRAKPGTQQHLILTALLRSQRPATVVATALKDL